MFWFNVTRLRRFNQGGHLTSRTNLKGDQADIVTIHIYYLPNRTTTLAPAATFAPGAGD
jgi:hypothetical protein